MIDLIDRRAVIDILDRAWVDGMEYEGWLHKEINEIPSAEQKKGKWILDPDTGGITCEACGAAVEHASYFCPWCGADMRAKE